MTKPADGRLDPWKDMTFKVEEGFHRDYKSTAARFGISMKDLSEYTLDLAKSRGFPGTEQKKS